MMIGKEKASLLGMGLLILCLFFVAGYQAQAIRALEKKIVDLEQFPNQRDIWIDGKGGYAILNRKYVSVEGSKRTVSRCGTNTRLVRMTNSFWSTLTILP